MTRTDEDYFSLLLDDVEPGTRYFFRLNGAKDLPDPVSRRQPGTVHEASEVVDPAFDWTDGAWHGLPLERYVIYELHVGAFTREGTFEAIIPRLPDLVDLGITAIEIMPIAQFAGRRGWGYDGVYPFAVQNSYGRPDDLRRLVDACHRHGIAVILDVVYNHLGPEGAYLDQFGHYFTDRYQTAWGKAINFDGPRSDEVRRYYLENALYWINDFHIDALRLDAIHAIHDESAYPFLQELVETIGRNAVNINRLTYAVAESDLNDIRVLRPPALGGKGIHAQWSDDFHHSIFAVLTGEKEGYYEDYGKFEQLVNAYTHGYTYTGQYSKSRGRRHGNPPYQVPAKQFVVFLHNHDQVGNRKLCDRMSDMITFEAQKLAAGTVILSPYLPMLFMGEEYGETAPFFYFVDFQDPQLIRAVEESRVAETGACADDQPPSPQSEEAFLRSKLKHERRTKGRHAELYAFHREAIRLRKELVVLRFPDKDKMNVIPDERDRTVFVHRWNGDDETFLLFNFSRRPINAEARLPEGLWRLELDSAAKQWGGPGSEVAMEFQSLDEFVSFPLQPTSLLVYSRRPPFPY